jgi:hypothetical protein
LQSLKSDCRIPGTREEETMRFRILAGSLVLVALATAGTYATGGAGVAPLRQWAIVQLKNPTLIAGRFVMGSVMFVHDEQKMAAGLPCTEVYRFEPGKGPTELVTAFHCVPRSRNVAGTFLMTTYGTPGTPLRLTEYQFAGDAEGHGIPVTATRAAVQHDHVATCCDKASCSQRAECCSKAACDKAECCGNATCSEGCCGGGR